MDWQGVHRRTVISFLVLAILLLGAGSVIYRNINKLSRLEYENQRRFLEVSLLNFRRDFTGTLLDFTRAFELPIWAHSTEGLQRQLVERYQLLLEENLDLSLISHLSFLVFQEKQPDAYFRFFPAETLFKEQAIPVSLQDAGYSLPGRAVPRRGRGNSRLRLLDDELVIIIPHGSNRTGLRRRPGGPPPGFRFPSPPEVRANPDRSDGRDSASTFLVLLTIDRGYLEREVFDRLERIHFRGPLIPGFELAITTAAQKVVYLRNKKLDLSFFSSADALIPLVAPAGRIPPFTLAREPRPGDRPGYPETGELNLLARHRLGSLEAAISRRRNYDLLEAFGILLLLSVAAVTLVLSVQRTRTLAKRQIDFVAGISHELRNPLTAIQSAGFNLSKGTVRDQDKIRKYGQLITREGRRLTHMVEQVMSYAGMQQTSGGYDRQILRIEEILETVLQEYAAVFTEESWDVEVQVGEDLPFISADPKALRSCLRNLIDNAMKYAEAVKWLRVEAGSGESSGKLWVNFSVQDRGRGISRSELPHIFEPFYRGADHVASSKPGTGLGLALVKRHVEAHGGKVLVHSELGKGATIQLSFPAAEVSDMAGEGKNEA